VAEVARMLGGERSSGTSLAHAQELITQAVAADREAAMPAAPSSAGAAAPSPARARPGARS